MVLVPNILVSISGKPKAGKTFLSMSFPAPIKIYSFDLGATYVRTKFPDKEIDIKEFSLPVIESEDAQWAEPIWGELMKEYKTDIESGKYQTVVLDTATVVWQICHQAVTEEKNRKKILEIEYFKPNLLMSSFFTRARLGGVNLVTIQYLAPIYVKGENTGQFGVDGWKRTEGNVDLVLEMESKTIGEGRAARTQMITLVKDNRFDRDLNGQIFVDTTYDELIALLGV